MSSMKGLFHSEAPCLYISNEGLWPCLWWAMFIPYSWVQSESTAQDDNAQGNQYYQGFFYCQVIPLAYLEGFEEADYTLMLIDDCKSSR